MVPPEVEKPRFSPVLRYGLLMLAGQALLRIWFLSGSWFYFDDLAFMSAGMNDKLDLHFLARDYAGHLMPGAWFVIKVLAVWAPYDWTIWAGVLVALQAVASYGMLRLLRSMFGDRPFVLALFAGYLFWIFTIPAGVWFAAGINQLPLQIALVFGLHAHLEYLRTHRVGALAQTLGWTVFGLLFYEKSIILFGLYALITLGWFVKGSLGERLSSAWSTYRLGVIAHACVAIPYIAIYLKYGLDLGGSSTPSSLLAAVAYRLVGVALSTGLIGGPFQWKSMSANALANPTDLVSLISWVALGALVWYAHHTRTKSRRAWMLILATSAVNVYLLAAARATLVGADIGLEYRYQTEAAAVAVLTIGLALLPLRGAVEVNEVRPDAERVADRPIVVQLVTVVVVACALVSTLAYVQNWQDKNVTPAYYDNVKTSLANAHLKQVPLVDGSLPQNLLWAFGFPENTDSHVFRNLADQTDYPSSTVDHLYTFNDAGQLTFALIKPRRTMVPQQGCGYILKKNKPTVIPLDGPVIGGGWWIEMGYAGANDFKLKVTYGDHTKVMRLPAGLHTAFFEASGAFDSVTLDNGPRGATSCVGKLNLGEPEPGPVVR